MKHFKRKLYVATFFNGTENDWEIFTSNAPDLTAVEKEFKAWFEADMGVTIEDLEVYPQEKVDGYVVRLETPRKR